MSRAAGLQKDFAAHENQDDAPRQLRPGLVAQAEDRRRPLDGRLCRLRLQGPVRPAAPAAQPKEENPMKKRILAALVLAAIVGRNRVGNQHLAQHNLQRVVFPLAQVKERCKIIIPMRHGVVEGQHRNYRAGERQGG